MNNYGYIEPVILPDEYVLGQEKLGREPINPSGNWVDYLPMFEAQRKDFETSNCTAFATTSIFEILFKKIFNEDVNFSDRALGIMAGTYPPGNSPHKVAETARKNGLVPEDLLPFGGDSVDDYYDKKHLTRKVVKAGEKFLREYEIGHEWVFNPMPWSNTGDKNKKMMEALQYSPLGVSVQAWKERDGLYYKDGSDNHWTVCVMGYKENEYWIIYDSYTDGSPLKKLEWDYDFGYCKRYRLAKGEAPQSWWRNLWGFLKRFML